MFQGDVQLISEVGDELISVVGVQAFLRVFYAT